MMASERRKAEVRVFLPPAIVERLDHLVDLGFYDTRSEVVRDVLVRHFLPELSDVPPRGPPMEGVVARVFRHRDAEYRFVANFGKLSGGGQAVSRLSGFLSSVASGRVPRNFGSGLRVTDITIPEPPVYRTMRRARFGELVRREQAGGHSAVLSALVEDPSTPMVACEVPLWSQGCFVTGHADLIEVTGDGERPLVVWDYKPELAGRAVVQVYLYRMLLARTLALPERMVGMGLFDAEHEVLYEVRA